MNPDLEHIHDEDWESTLEDRRARVRSENLRACIAMAGTGTVIVAWLCFVFGCVSPTVPERVESHAASFDGNAQNSGVIASTATGFVVTDHFRDRHNALIVIYGGDFRPALVYDHGITPLAPDRWLISKQAMSDFLLMRDWQRAGIAPKGRP